MSETRDQIRAQVRANAGIHFNELVRESAFAPGQIQYHVRRLIEADELVREERYGQTHYYPPEYDEWERAALALFRRETAREIVVFLLEHGPSRPAAVADDLDVARSTLEYHLDNLVECDVVAKAYGERNRVTLSLARPDRTAALLSEVSPTVPDRLVDRFTRLVDGVLEDATESR
ncbi:winged helix-turn-helix transcriptional regulator [Haloterrigena alkaliphila]|uniref:ArsR family transcriptional regulator n=1 Tax=Haloterrigena alkaliphila TaxID=2816475 RepID=A0A8A2VEK9_9EURY|nr:ArsR family transcriptional regulator [Haloterrigena alkaliphila]QSW99696.1 ArsR family transcriptional regulator [Haloterrigena alkaliphila]